MEVFLVPVGWHRINGHPSDPLKTWAGAEGISLVPNLFREMVGGEGGGEGCAWKQQSSMSRGSVKKKKGEKRKEIKSMGKEKEKLEEKAAYAGWEKEKAALCWPMLLMSFGWNISAREPFFKCGLVFSSEQQTTGSQLGSGASCVALWQTTCVSAQHSPARPAAQINVYFILIVAH